MDLKPLHFIDEQIRVEFDKPPLYEKKPDCPDRFIWQDEVYKITQLLAEWQDFQRHGRMARNMSPPHAAAASQRGSWGVGRFYFRVRTSSRRVFDLYYDRAPKDADDRKGAWFLFREMQPEDADN